MQACTLTAMIHRWNDPQPLTPTTPPFFARKIAAYELGYPKTPCYALGQRVDERHNGKTVTAVFEYILDLTDSVIILLALLNIESLAYLLGAICIVFPFWTSDELCPHPVCRVPGALATGT